MNMAKNIPPVKAESENHHIKIEDDFGNTNVNGLQWKGAISVNNQAYFAKLDDLNPTVNGEWEKRYDVQYSSVSEAIASALIKNIKTKDNFDSVEYQFSTFDLKGRQTSGTISKNYLRENESERVLAIGRKMDPHTLITTDEYAEQIMDVSTQDRFDHFIKYFTDHNVPYEHAKQFLIKQAAFDILTGNVDRLGNPSNFIIAYDNKNETGRLVNFDYGRSLQMTWTDTTEEKYDLEWLKDDLDDFSNELTSNNDSIISSLSKKDSIQFLKDNGFEPFQIDMKSLKEDLDNLNQTIQNADVPFKKFASSKIESFKKSLESDYSKEFYKEYNPQKQTSINFSIEIEDDKDSSPKPVFNKVVEPKTIQFDEPKSKTNQLEMEF